MNTGVQRMVRGIFAALSARSQVTPLLWSPKLNSYCRLTARERRFLVEPFARHQQSSAKPEKLAARFPWSATVRYLHNRHRRFALERAATARDILFVPEIFQDNRIGKVRTLKTWFPGRTGAIFYDAIVLRLPEFTASTRKPHFPEYVQSLAQFDKVVCISREVETDLHHYWDLYGVKATATAVLGLPTDFGKRRPTPQSNFPAQRILCVATLERRKNHECLLEASEQLWGSGLNFELLLIGRSTPDWGPTVLGMVERLAKRGRSVKWLRHVSDKVLHEAYRDCSFTVYPSVREGFGLPILESLWHGRPCVCGDNGAIAEVAHGGGCQTMKSSDVNSLAAAMRELLMNETTYRRLFTEACDRTFRSWDDYTNDLYREIGAA
jgi:glycosyltransferase involved in cell wall biosynthesis